MEFNQNLPIYLQIANHFLENILQKKWTSEGKVPSIRDTAVEYEVNPNTMLRTYGYLQEKGIIYNKRGLGFFVSEDGYEKSLALKKEQFINEELPSLFKSMQLLSITVDELKERYTQFQQSNI